MRLWDILSGESQRKRQKFIRQLSLYEHGLGAFNAKADKAELPAARVVAQIYVTVRLPELPGKVGLRRKPKNGDFKK